MLYPYKDTKNYYNVKYVRGKTIKKQAATITDCRFVTPPGFKPGTA